MATDYLTFFNLNDDPFHLTPDTAYFYNSPAHATALLSLEYCVTQKEGFCILTGEPGTGKTTIQRLFTERWKERAEIALIMTPRLSPDEFFQAVLDDFKIPLSSSKNEMLKAFRDFLLTHAANDKRVAIIVDEAQELPESTLEELRLLSNMETEKEKLLQIILIGQPELRSKLLGIPLRQLNQRITVRVQLKHLTELESSDYINTRLIRAGISALLYDQNAKSLIYRLSDGIPRTINLLASRGLMSAFLDGSKIVLEKHVQKGAEDIMEPLALYSASRSVPPISAAPPGSAVGESALQRLALYTRNLIVATVAGIRNQFRGSASPAHPDPTKPVFENNVSAEDWRLPKPVVWEEPPGKTTAASPAEMLVLEVGYGLAQMVDASEAGDLFERIRFIRHQTAQKMGFDVPNINVQNNLKLKAYEYNLLIHGTRVGGSELTGQYLAMDSGAVTAEIPGISTREPIFGLPAVWIHSNDCEQAQTNGYTVVDSNTVIATHISELIKSHSHELIGSKEMQQLLDKVATAVPEVLAKLIPGLLDFDTVLKVVKNLLRDGDSIRDMKSIIECLAIHAALTKDAEKLAEFVRQGRVDIIIDQYKAG